MGKGGGTTPGLLPWKKGKGSLFTSHITLLAQRREGRNRQVTLSSWGDRREPLPVRYALSEEKKKKKKEKKRETTVNALSRCSATREAGRHRMPLRLLPSHARKKEKGKSPGRGLSSRIIYWGTMRPGVPPLQPLCDRAEGGRKRNGSGWRWTPNSVSRSVIVRRCGPFRYKRRKGRRKRERSRGLWGDYAGPQRSG